jgi:hypothetical protein
VTPWITLKKVNNGHKTLNKVVYFILLDLKKKKSSLKIPLLHHAASINTEAEGGRMVKEWNFEAGKKFKDSKQIK